MSSEWYAEANIWDHTFFCVCIQCNIKYTQILPVCHSISVGIKQLERYNNLNINTLKKSKIPYLRQNKD